MVKKMNPLMIVVVIVAVYLFLTYGTYTRTVDVTAIKKVINEKMQIIRMYQKWYSDIPIDRIVAMMAYESSGNSWAVGSSGEKGLMQLTKGAVIEFCKYYNKDVEIYSNNYWEDYFNVEAGIGYLQMKLDKYKDLDTATKSYNAGDNINIPKAIDYLYYVKSYELKVKEILK